MTITEALDYVKKFHQEDASLRPNWSDLELYKLFEAKSNECLSLIGLVEGKDTSTVSVIAQADYNYPSNYIRIRRVRYANVALKYLDFRQFEARQPTGVAPSGTPREWTQWNNVITLFPTPVVASDVITIYGEKQQSAITGTSSTLDTPAVFHHALCEAVIGEMFAKDLNQAMAQMYMLKWQNVHIPAMRKFSARRRRVGLPTTVIDVDSSMETEHGLI